MKTLQLMIGIKLDETIDKNWFFCWESLYKRYFVIRQLWNRVVGERAQIRTYTHNCKILSLDTTNNKMLLNLERIIMMMYCTRPGVCWSIDCIDRPSPPHRALVDDVVMVINGKFDYGCWSNCVRFKPCHDSNDSKMNERDEDDSQYVS